MSRLSRAEVFSPDEIAIVHVMNRVVRRCFLMGYDSVTGKDYSYRRRWIEEQFERQAAYFAIDLLCYAVMSNHFHQVLRSRPDVALSWSRREVARRWLMLCPKRKRKDGSACEPKEAELNSIANNDRVVDEMRSRLSDISWWMRLLCQRIAQRCNAEDEMKGKFWESRFRAVRLLDEESILACAAYVELNPIRAAIAENLEGSDYTSIQRRLQDMLIDLEAAAEIPQVHDPSQTPTTLQSISPAANQDTANQDTANQGETTQNVLTQETTVQHRIESPSWPDCGAVTLAATANESLTSDQTLGGMQHNAPPVAQLLPGPKRRSGFLAPLEINEREDELGARPSNSGQRASDKGFLNMPLAAYVELLDWTARQLVAQRSERTLEDFPPVFERLSVRPEVWYQLVTQFGALFSLVAGRPQRVDAERGRVRGQRFYMRAAARELLAA